MILKRLFENLLVWAVRNQKIPTYISGMKLKLIVTLEECDVWLHDDGALRYVAKAAIDSDGSDNRHRDPCWQRDTSLNHEGKPIDAESVPYIVVPPSIIAGVPDVVLGCRAIVTNTENNRTCESVVADVGPRKKLGELSCEAARRLGLSGNPNNGGTSERIILYEIFPGVPAKVDGVTYKLKPSAF